MKVKLLKYIMYSFNVLLLFSTFQVVRADQNNKCPSVNSGSACVNNGTINNTTHIYNPIIIDSSQYTNTLLPPSVRSTVTEQQNKPYRVKRIPVPQEALTSNEEPPKPTIFPNNSAFSVNRK